MSKEERYIWKVMDNWQDIIYDKETNKRLRTDKESIVALLNQQNQRIAELEEQLKNATHKFNIYQEVYYLDYKYKFEPYVSKYLTVCKGKVLDIILREEGWVDYNFTFDDLKWITEENVFATKDEALKKLEELKGE